MTHPDILVRVSLLFVGNWVRSSVGHKQLVCILHCCQGCVCVVLPFFLDQRLRKYAISKLLPKCSAGIAGRIAKRRVPQWPHAQEKQLQITVTFGRSHLHLSCSPDSNRSPMQSTHHSICVNIFGQTLNNDLLPKDAFTPRIATQHNIAWYMVTT